jgi:hypothetical protein
MTEITDTPVGVDINASNLRRQLLKAVNHSNKAIETLRITDGEPPLAIEEMGTSVRNTKPAEQIGDFRFWGGLENGFSNVFFEPTAIIKDIVVPRKGEGFGSRVVTAWEEGMTTVGINHFVATNIRNLDAMRFWTKQGYVPFGRIQEDGVPYAMIKGSSGV